MATKDLPKLPDNIPESLGRPLRRMREELQRLTGFLGDDPALTLRNASGLGSGSTTVIIGGGGTGGTGGDEPDPTPPPMVSNLAAAAGITQVIVTWSGITYTQGHGNKQTLIYAVKKAVSDLTMPTFPGDAGLVGAAPQALTILALPSEPNTRWHIWAKFETNDGVKSTDPAGGANGVIVTTAQDPALLLEALTGRITRSQLFDDIGTPIDLVSAAENVAGSVNARIKTERDRATGVEGTIQSTLAEINADLTDPTTGQRYEATVLDVIRTQVNNPTTGNAALATRASALEAKTQPFSPALSWEFNGTLDGWQALPVAATSYGTLATAAAHVVVVSGGGAPVEPGDIILRRTGFSVAGSAATKIRMRLKRAAGATPWYGIVYYHTTLHARSGVHYKEITEPAWGPDGWGVAEWDMASLTAGGSDWVDSTITGLDIDLTRGTPGGVSTWHIDWIAIGDRGVGVSAATVSQIDQAIVSLENDKAEASSVTTLSAQVNNPTTGLPAAHAAVATEASARAALDGSVQALYTVRVQASGNGTSVVGGIGLSATSTAAGGPTINFGVRADQFFIAPPSGQNVPSTVPFIVRTTATTEGGLTINPGVYMDAAYIVNLTALHARIATLIADQIVTASLSAAQLTAGDGTIGGNLKSANWPAGGWLLTPSGTAFFMNAVIGNSTTTATIYAGAGTIGGFTINAADLRSNDFAEGAAGLRLRAGAVGPGEYQAEFYNIKARGDILATNIAANATITSPTITGGTINSTTLNSTTVNSSTFVGGVVRNTGFTNYVDLNATGTQTALSFGNGKARITANGEAYFLSNILTDTWSASPGALYYNTIEANGAIVDEATFLIDTGYNVTYDQVVDRTLSCRTGAAGVNAEAGSVSPGNYMTTPIIDAKVVLGVPMFRTGAAANLAQNPYGGANARVYIRVRVSTAPVANNVNTIRLTSLQWFLDWVG